jgi:large subunit ribosomal protein L3
VRYLREFRTKDLEINEGDQLGVDVFEVGEFVDIVGVSKGKGFAGVVKRYHFAGGPKTHGQSDRLRATGSIGATSGTARVFPGKRMPGHMGNKQVTAPNLKVILVDAERNLIAVRGSVPGPKGGVLVIKETRKQ